MSSHATHFLMLVIICTKYGKNPSRTVDATERTRFSRTRPNDLEDIGQGQRSLYATHPLILVIICAKYGKNPSRIVDFFFQGQGRKICQKFKFSDSETIVTRDTPSNDSNYLCHIKQGKSEGFDSCDRPSNLKLDSNRQFFCSCDRQIWWTTLQNNRAHLLCYF